MKATLYRGDCLEVLAAMEPVIDMEDEDGND